MSEVANHSIKSLERTIIIVESMKKTEWKGVTELAETTDVTKASVHQHLKTLERNGFVVSRDGEYRLGMRFLELGLRARDRLTLYQVGHPELKKLAASTGERANLMVEENGLGVYVDIATGQQGLSLDTNVGSQQHLHTSGLGKAILAHLPPKRVDRIIGRHGLPEKTANTITDREELFRELETIRERGLAFEREERVEGIQCVAAPVQDNDGQLLGAVSVSGPASRMTETRFRDEISEQVKETATVIRINATYE